MMGQLNRHMHNSAFSMAQCEMMSFPLTTGVKADNMGTEIIVKIQTTECDSVTIFQRNTIAISGQNYINPNRYLLSPSQH